MVIFCKVFILFVRASRVTLLLTKIKVATPTMRTVFKTSIHLSKKYQNYAATKIALLTAFGFKLHLVRFYGCFSFCCIKNKFY